ncbi:MAG TPA: GntR family transcriptional regulator [Nocardioidaceae bacterium]|nr:GntR family transcriptional regulator [Nocardioidaceae bacterium]
MALKPVARRLVPDEVFDQILSDVVDGELAPGESLPSERRLAEVLGVSRPAVREALQRMAQARLVEVRHGGATTVREFRRSAGLDLLPRLLVRNGELDVSVARSILEARLAIAPEVAALAAERGSAAVHEALQEAIAALEADEDPVARQRAALTFWDHMVDGADSVVFRLMFNSLRAAYEPTIDALAVLMEAEVSQLEGYREVRAAVVAHDPEVARAATERLLRPATTTLITAIHDLEEA